MEFELKGDLENILLKALHLDAQRRYASAREFAQDIENYLADRPVRATDSRAIDAGAFAAQPDRVDCSRLGVGGDRRRHGFLAL